MYFITSLYLFIMSIFLFFFSTIFFLMNYSILIKLNLLKFNSFNFEFIMFFDWMTFSFISVVFIISSMVMIYSIEYMNNHIYLKRFMMLIMIFFLSMMLMIISPNMLSILIGWDGLGLSSYCLIIFYQNKKAFNSGMITLLMNRIGDISILIMISLLINLNSLNFLFLKNTPNSMLIFIMIAAITKSAQIPFSTWLPLAMAAPTPVSSLVHSSTLVTAGIYLMIRMNYLFNSKFLMILMWLSLCTMILASSSAMCEFDLKKIIALSTLSQLALMFLAISVNLTMLSFFHMITHAMFKSLLFLCSGIIIHNYMNNQDIRLISNISMNMPVISIIFNTASLALCGMPFLSAFYSKDLIIEMFNMYNMNCFIFNLMYLCMMMTVIYSFRLIFYISFKSIENKMFNKFKSLNKMNYSIYLLYLFTLIYGSMMNWFLMNSINISVLNLNIKMMIWKLLFYSFNLNILLLFKNKTNKYVLKFTKFINSLWFLNFMFKKSKYILFMLSKLIELNEISWIELISSKQFIYLINKMNKLNKIKNLTFSMLINLTLYFIMYFYINM